MEDIEDMFKHEDDQTEQRTNNYKKKVMRKNQKQNQPLTELQQNQQNEDNSEIAQDQSTDQSQFNPGQSKIFVKTYGCSHNISDSEYMAGLLQEQGYQIVDSLEQADACLLNSCTVKNPSQEKFVNLVNQAKSQNKQVIVSGCVPQGDRNVKGLEDVSVIGVTQIDRVVEVVEEALKGNKVKLLAKKNLPTLDLPKIRKNKLVEIIPLSTGCLGSCTYCKTVYARGKLGSYDPNAIVERVKSAISEGVMEIWLTSEDTGAYGRDIKTSLPQLLKSIIAVMPNHTMLRLGMTNPPYIMEHLEAMGDIMNHPRVYQFLHVPVQSGSNAVLEKMNREYYVEEFQEVCDVLRRRVQDVTLATDIICGFPTETAEDFEETLKLVDHYKFPVLNISQFYARPGTVAAKWKKVPSQEVKRRSMELTKLFDSYTTNNHFVGTEQRVWIIGFDDRQKRSEVGPKQLMGHTKTYTKVVLNPTQEVIGDQPPESLIGRCVLIKVTEAQKWHISGYIIDANPKPIEVLADYFEKLEKERERKKLKEKEEKEKEAIQQVNVEGSRSGENEKGQNVALLFGIVLIGAGVLWMAMKLMSQ